MPRTSSLALTLLVAALGCSSNTFLPSSTNAVSVTGNWQLAAPTATRLSALSGELTGSGSTISGIFHADSALSCVAPSTVIDLTGKTSSANVLTLTGALAGGTLTVSGTLASNGKSLLNATYQVVGGSCAFAPAAASAQLYTPISGTFNGTFADASGPVITVSAALSQSPASDTSGNFTLTGTGTFASNPCFSSPVTVSNTQVTGGAFTLTYADPVTLNSVTASGTFTPDGSTLNVTNWALTGSCGPDTGTGTLTRQ